MKLIKSSELAQFLWCPYALELARRGVAPDAKEAVTRGTILSVVSGIIAVVGIAVSAKGIMAKPR